MHGKFILSIIVLVFCCYSQSPNGLDIALQFQNGDRSPLVSFGYVLVPQTEPQYSFETGLVYKQQSYSFQASLIGIYGGCILRLWPFFRPGILTGSVFDIERNSFQPYIAGIVQIWALSLVASTYGEGMGINFKF